MPGHYRRLVATGHRTSGHWAPQNAYKPFDDPVFMDLLELVVRKLEVNALEIDREFIHELDALYLFLDEQLDIRKLQKRLTGENRA